MTQSKKPVAPVRSRMADRGLPRQGSWRAWLIFMLWIGSSLAGFIAAYNIGLLLPSIRQELSLTSGEQGLLSSAAFWGNLVLIVPLTWWTSRFSPLKTIIVTIVFAGLFLLMQGWAPIFIVLVLGRMGLGLATVAIDPPGAVLIQQWFPKHRIVLINSIGNAVFSICLGIGLLATPFVLNALGGRWRVTFYILAGAFAFFMVLWAVIGRERVTRKKKQAVEVGDEGSPLNILKERDIWFAGLGMLGGNAVMSGFLSFFPTLMLDTYRVSEVWSGVLLAIGLMMAGILSIAIGYFVTVTGRRKETLVLMGLVMVLAHIGLTLTGSLYFLVPLAIVAVGMHAFNPLLFSVPFHLPGIRPKQTSVAIAFIMVAVSAGTIIGPLIAGYLEGTFGGFKVPLIIVACFGVLISIAGLTLRHSVATAPSARAEARQPSAA